MSHNPQIVPRAATAPLLPGDLHPLLKRIYSQRGVTDERQLQTSASLLQPCEGLSGMSTATTILAEALERQQRILVVGDFDADGATSSALAVRALRAFGARHVDYLVPSRFEYGYGLTPEIVAAGAAFAPDLLITVDNGVSSIEGVEAARAHGMRVIVTDHHLPGQQLPAADAIVNPNLHDDPFPSKCLAGVGVIFYVMLALRRRLRERKWFTRADIAEPNMAHYLDLVALGTVADVVPLDHNNRILVEQGLRRIRAGRCVTGILALLQTAGRLSERAIASDLSFAVAPRLNAAGRLQTMQIGIECLLTDDDARALELADQLDALNRQRRAIEGEMHAQALCVMQDLDGSLTEHELPYGICLFDGAWHQGVIGILAGRIKDRFHRPVVAFADAAKGLLKGSARSVAGLHIRDLLEIVATRNPGLITRFGGHAMAAGLTLPAAHLNAFRNAFDRAVREVMTLEQLEGVLYTDGSLSETDLTPAVARLLRVSGPWGQGFPEPCFDGVFEVVSHRRVSGRHLKLSLRPQGGVCVIDAIVFNIETFDWREDLAVVHILYRFEENEYQGLLRPQLTVTHLQAASS